MINTQKHKSHFLIGLIILTTLLLGCSSKPEEQYVDYFYSYVDQKNKDSFTYILYIGDKGERGLPQEQSDSRLIPERQKQSNRGQSGRKPKGDEFMSISFRMEEEAFDRLGKILLDRDFCSGEVEYLENEYSWLRYTIKGYCKID